MLDFNHLRVKRQPTKVQEKLYRKWVKYLKNSRLSEDQIHERASHYASLNLTIKDLDFACT